MNWKTLETIVNDSGAKLPEENVARISAVLEKEIHQDSKPLEAAKIAYALAIVALRKEVVIEKDVLRYVDFLSQTIDHEISEIECLEKEGSSYRIVSLRKQAEHEYHHLMVLADGRNAKQVVKTLIRLRRKNYESMLKNLHLDRTLLSREKRFLKRTLRKHAIATGILVSLALYFGLNAFFALSDYAVASWALSTISQKPSQLFSQILMVFFSGAVLWLLTQSQRG